MSIRVNVKLPSSKKGEWREEKLLFREEDHSLSALEYIIKQFQLINETGYTIYNPKNGTYLKKLETFFNANVKDDDRIEIHPKASVDKINLCFPLSQEVLKNASLTSLQPILKVCKVNWRDPIHRIVPFVIKQFNVSVKEEYAFRKVKLQDDGTITSVGDFINVNLSPKENNLRKGGLLVIEPVIFADKSYEHVPQNRIKREGMMAKNSKKGDGKVTGMKKRWCVLQDNFLYYFANNKGPTKISGVVDLEYMIMSKDGSLGIRLESAPFSFRQIPHTYVFELETEKDRNDWFTQLRHCVVNGDYRRVFGISLEKLIKRPTQTLNVIVKCINQLDSRGLDTEGIFKNGVQQKVDVLKEEFNSGKDPNLAEADINNIALLLKQFLRELPEPLLTYNLYKRWITAENVSHLQENINALPPANQAVLEILLYFFGRLLDHKSKNGLDMMNLCYIFSPAVLQPTSPNEGTSDGSQLPRVIRLLIENRFHIKFSRVKGKKLSLKNKVQARVLYDYVSKGQKNAKGETDLGVKKGDVVVLLEEPRSNGWIMCKMLSEQGLVPCNYLKKFDPPGEIKISNAKRSEEKRRGKKSARKSSSSSKINVTDSKNDSNVDYRSKYEAEVKNKQEMIEEIRQLKMRLFDYESQYGPLSFGSLPMISIDNLPPPPEEFFD